MREIVLDTETTGFEPTEGHRIVEIGAVELFNHLPTGRTYHQYLNPQRMMPAEAFAVHGLGDDFLRDKPLFAAVAQDFLTFIADAQLVIHNAAFDMKFLNFELTRVGHPPLPNTRATDTLMIARQKFPGSPASLDALLDSEILAEVYLELVGGRQPDFGLSPEQQRSNREATQTEVWRPRPRPTPLPPRLTAEETAAHQAFVGKIADAIWTKR